MSSPLKIHPSKQRSSNSSVGEGPGVSQFLPNEERDPGIGYERQQEMAGKGDFALYGDQPTTIAPRRGLLKRDSLRDAAQLATPSSKIAAKEGPFKRRAVFKLGAQCDRFLTRRRQRRHQEGAREFVRGCQGGDNLSPSLRLSVTPSSPTTAAATHSFRCSHAAALAQSNRKRKGSSHIRDAIWKPAWMKDSATATFPASR